ncbi:UNVERIFIED_CONTAM: hypothetical protein K2H54_055853 [Gekko kuhli]
MKQKKDEDPLEFLVKLSKELLDLGYPETEVKENKILMNTLFIQNSLPAIITELLKLEMVLHARAAQECGKKEVVEEEEPPIPGCGHNGSPMGVATSFIDKQSEVLGLKDTMWWDGCFSLFMASNQQQQILLSPLSSCLILAVDLQVLQYFKAYCAWVFCLIPQTLH